MKKLHPFYFSSAGLRFFVRPVIPSDRESLQKGFCELSEKSKSLRFNTINPKLSDSQLNYFMNVDGINHVAWGILDVSGDNPKPVGIGRFVKVKQGAHTAELAITIADLYQKKGLGRTLFAVLNVLANHVGIENLRYFVHKKNHTVLRFLKYFVFLKEDIDSNEIIIDTKVFPAFRKEPDDKIINFKATIERTKELMRG